MTNLTRDEVLQLSTENPIYEIRTDYFGGCGEQEAFKHFQGKTQHFASINAALKDLGFVKSEDAHDEFEAAGFCNFRSNSDFFEGQDTEDAIAETEGVELPNLTLEGTTLKGENIVTVDDLIYALQKLPSDMRLVDVKITV